MALLRPGRCCSRRQGGCLQHRTEAQRRPMGQDAGGTPALPGVAVPAVPWVSGGRLLRKPTCTLWETPVCPRAGPPPCCGDHSRENGRPLMKTNHEWTRMNTKTDGLPSAASGAKMLLSLLSRWCDPVMGGSPPGSAGVPPAQILPQLRPSPPPESTGSGALPLLRPGPCGSRRQGGRLQHRRETERQPKGQHAGGTPALPGGSSRW